MRFSVTLALGFVLDLLALPVTVELWKELIHSPIAALLVDTGWMVVLALLLFDATGALVIIVGIGIMASSLCVDFLIKLFAK